MKKRCNVLLGTTITGKWHGNHYTIIKQLGSGANGIVYLARTKNNQVALKMSNNSTSIISEVNVLKSFERVQDLVFGPSLLDVDDWVRNDGNISFYVMEYIQGPNLLEFIGRQGKSWTVVLILQLLNDLQQLHENGWVFGDLKPENLIVTGPPSRVRCIDVGGTTIQGRAIKEFTEFYDRGYWGLGSRKADPGYDLFAVAMMLIQTEYPHRFSKQQGGLEQLRQVCQQKKVLRLYEPVINKALNGRYRSANEMRTDLIFYTHQSNYQKRRLYHSKKATHSSQQGARKNRVAKQSKKSHLLETTLILAIVSVFYLFYLFGQIM